MKLLILICSVALAAPEPATRPTDATFISCVTSECHSALKKSPIVHAPVAGNACDACHELASAKKHTFTHIRKGSEMCTYCHEFDISSMPVVHKPVTTGECLGCHDPHGGNSRALVREDSVPELCGRCHESLTLGHDFVHTPVMRGECDSCHASHASRYPKLLDAVGWELCLACHKLLESRIASVKFSHKALEQEGECQKCHNVHASEYPNGLTLAPPQLCSQCHDKVASAVATAPFKHRVVSEDQACLTCHAPHGSDHERLMIDLPAKVCLSCHGEKIPGLEMAAVPEVRDPTLIKHGPISQGKCSGCHTPHGGSTAAMLTKRYSTKFYEMFDAMDYQLCFSCHDQRLATERATTSATSFRNGDKNLHHLHITESDKGRGCGVCHALHAAPNDRMVRQTFKFGQRQLPINFQRTETGGMCLTGCHVAYQYDRVTPLPATTRPATRPIHIVTTRPSTNPITEKQLAQQSTSERDQRMKSYLLVDQANRLLARGEDVGAEKLITQSLKLAPDYPPAIIARARILIQIERPQEAKAVLHDALKQNPALLEAHLVLGELYEREQNWQAAAGEYRAAQTRRSLTSRPTHRSSD